MRTPHFTQDWIAAGMAVLVLWAFLQLGPPFGLTWWVTLPAGAAAAALILRARARERAMGGGEAGDTPRRWVPWLLVGIVLAATVVRLHMVLDRVVWEDEMWTLRNIYTSDWGELFRVALDDYWPPLHYVILNAVARVAGTDVLSLRLPSVVFGVAGVAAMYPLGRTVLGTRTAGLAAAALLAGMTTHVLYSQEARVYSLQVLLVILSATWFYRSWQEKRISPAFLFFTTLLTYSHSFASWYFVAAEAAFVVVAWLLWRDREAFVKGFVSQVLVVLLWLPLLGGFLYARTTREIVVPTYWATGSGVPGPLDFIELYQSLFVRSWAGAAFMAVLLALAVVPLVARPRGARPPPRRPALVFLLCWALVPALFSLVVTVATSMETFGEIRYHMAMLPGLCLLAASGLHLVRSRAALAGIAALLVLLPTAQLARHFQEFERNRPDMRAAAELVRDLSVDDEPIYVGNGFRAFAYYFRGIFPRIGSPAWDSLARAHGSYTDRYTMQSVKWGDTYAYEKISPRIAYFGYYPGRPASFDLFIEDELERGGLRPPYWLVLRDVVNHPFLDALDAAGVKCPDPVVHEVDGLRLLHCGAATTMRVTSMAR